MSELPDYLVMRIFPVAEGDYIFSAGSRLPTSPAGRLAFAHDLLNGFPLVDDDGNETGERSEPVITLEQFREIVER